MLRTTTQFTPTTNFSKANNPPAYSVQQQRQGVHILDGTVKKLAEDWVQSVRSIHPNQQGKWTSEFLRLMTQIAEHEDTMSLDVQKGDWHRPNEYGLRLRNSKGEYFEDVFFDDQKHTVEMKTNLGPQQFLYRLKNLLGNLPGVTARQHQYPFAGWTKPNQQIREVVVPVIPADTTLITTNLEPIRKLLPGTNYGH